MATFVLVPGAWLGGWVWQEVARELRRRGHEVYPVTLTGLGERVHLARPDVDLETHITDVVNLLVYEDLRDVILAGHSYAGAVVPGVADRVPERLGQLVYVDTGPLADGQSILDLFGPDGRAEVERIVASGDGWRLPFPPFDQLGQTASMAGLDAADRTLMETRAVSQPFATYQQPLRLSGTDGAGFRCTVIACDDIRELVAAGVPQILAMTAAPWRYEELATGHWPMLSAPRELVSLLDRLADEG